MICSAFIAKSCNRILPKSCPHHNVLGIQQTSDDPLRLKRRTWQNTNWKGSQGHYLDQVKDEPGGDTLTYYIDEEVCKGHAPNEWVLQHIVDQQAEKTLLGLCWFSLCLDHPKFPVHGCAKQVSKAPTLSAEYNQGTICCQVQER